ncbi:MAG: hypothetical protein ACI84R_000593 [Candidatus Azotimanducaceae bacterium]|jgi:hypothetical protein
MLRWIFGGLMMVSLAACNGASDLQEAPAPLGDFRLGHNIVVAPKVAKGPLSRPATEEELTTAMKAAIAERFDRYDGEKLYHFGVSVEGYVLAAPGIPILFAPKSILIINVTVWDDAANAKLNAEPHQITVFESFGKGPVVGSGYTQTAEQQLENLSQNASKAIERYMVKQIRDEGWFAVK